MEKFSQWRDPATGIAPFIRTTDKRPVWTILLGLIRIILLFPLSLLVAVLPSISAKVDLLLSNVKLTVEYSIADNKWRSKGSHIPNSGDVIISNFTSPADPLIFTATYGRVWFSVPDDQGQLTLLSAREVQKIALKSPDDVIDFLRSKRKYTVNDLIQLAKKQAKILVIFPERTTSNNKGLLKLVNLSFEDVPANIHIYPAGIRYAPSNICTPLPISSWTWFWNSASSPSKYNARLRIHTRLNAGEFTMNSIARQICDAGRLTQVGYGFDDKQEFLHEWVKLKR